MSLTPDCTSALVSALHSGGAFHYLWQKGTQKITTWKPAGESLPDTCGQPETYFGVHPTTCIPLTNADGDPTPSKYVRGRIEIVACLNCLFVELDGKDFDASDPRGNGKVLALEHVNALEPAPSALVDSGGGYHGYWLFREPLLLKTEEDRKAACALQAAWVEHCHGDPGAKDLARVLRLPGTVNAKYPDRPVVTLVDWHPERVYSVEEFRARVVPQQGRASAAVSLGASRMSAPGGDISQRLLAEAVRQGVPGLGDHTGLWLACQLRDNQVSDGEARSVLGGYGAQATADPSKPFTDRDVERWWRSACSKPAREPWAEPGYRIPEAWDEFTAVAPEGDAKAGSAKAGDPKAVAGRGPSQATVMVCLAEERGISLFHTPAGDPYANIPIGGHRETWSLRTTSIRHWLARLYFQTCNSAPGGQATQDALQVLSGLALYDGPEIAVHMRLAEHEGAIYYDLANTEWGAIEITPSGWRVVSDPPVLFRRARGMLAMPAPVQSGVLSDIREYMHLTDDEYPLMAAWLVGAMSPRGPYPVAGVGGEHGAAKTTACRVARRLLDPNTADLRSAPRELRDLAIAAANGWVVAYDNLSDLPNWLSDALARISTGAGHATRMLHTDDEEMLFQACRPVLVNGIGDVIVRPDLMDRAIIFTMMTIPDDQRRLEREFWAAFDLSLPRLFGALLSATATAMRRLPDVVLPDPPRMADFAAWGHAAEPAFGVEPGTFLRRYRENRAAANEAAIGGDPVATAVRALVDVQPSNPLIDPPRPEWSGSAAALLEELEEREGYRTSDGRPGKRRPDGWPRDATRLRAAMTRFAPNLREEGYDIIFQRSHGRRSMIILGPSAQRREEDAEDTSYAGAKLVDRYDETVPLAGAAGAANETQRHPLAAPDNLNNDAIRGAGAAGAAEIAPLFYWHKMSKEEIEGEREGHTHLFRNKAKTAAPAAPAAPDPDPDEWMDPDG